MDFPRIFRRRYVPDEMVELKDDQILYLDDQLLITKWNILKPRKDIDHGLSIYYLKDGYKISKIYDSANALVYWYCDIIDTLYDAKDHTYIFSDLLTDVIIYPDRHVEVVDLDELADMIEQDALPIPLIEKSLRRTNSLLHLVYSGKLDELCAPLKKYDTP